MSDIDITGSISNEPSITGQFEPDIVIQGNVDSQFPAQISVASVATGDPGTDASVVNVGTPGNARLQFTIPRGAQGLQGNTGPQGIQGETGPAGADSTVPGPAGADGVVQSLVAGSNITIDATDPANPIINSTVSVSGDVVGPASAVDGNFAAFDTTTGKLIGDSGKAPSNFATASQGGKADSALQPSDVGTTANKIVALDGSGKLPAVDGSQLTGISSGSGTVTSVATSGLATGGPITGSGTITVPGASSSDQATGTSTSKVVTPAVQQSHPSAAKVWVRFNSSGVIAGSYNVSSITDNSVGSWTVNFTTAFSSGNYSGIASGGFLSGTSAIVYNVASLSGSAYSISAFQSISAGNADPTSTNAIFFQAFGGQ
jgi:hypothetical protein